MEEFRDKLLGDPVTFTLENRVFNFITLLAACMTSFVVVLNLIFGWLLAWDILFTVYWLSMYVSARFFGFFKRSALATVAVLVFAFLPYIWLSSSGSESAIPFYTVVFVAAIGVVVKGRKRLFFTLAMMVVIGGLMTHEAGSVVHVLQVPYISRMASLFAMISGMAVLILVVSNTYVGEKERSDAYAKTIEEQVEQQLYYMENLDEVIFKLKSERHDFNNHLGVIYGLLENGESSQAAAYAKELVKRDEKVRNIVNLPYPMLRAMLNYKLSGAQEAGIDLRLSVRVPKGLGLNEIDTTVIVGNLLDNAMEACGQLEPDQRYLCMDMAYKPDYLVIRIENPMTGNRMEEDLVYPTSKPDHENHGFGLKNVEHLVKRHDGLMKIMPGHGVFAVQIALLMK